MKLEDFNRIDPKNMGSLPIPVKAVILGIVLGMILVAGFWFFWDPALEDLKKAQQKEAELREIFLAKKKEAVNLPAYKQQMRDIERTFGALLRQLPNKAQMDALLTDINQAGLERGLEFELFKPGQEKPAEFYAVMPISIRVTGSYHDFGAFATDISKLSRIVTFGDLTIGSAGKDAKDDRLAMEAVTMTYRYLDPAEIASKKKTEKKGAKPKTATSDETKKGH